MAKVFIDTLCALIGRVELRRILSVDQGPQRTVLEHLLLSLF